MTTATPTDPRLRHRELGLKPGSGPVTISAAELLPAPGIEHELGFRAMGTNVRLLIGAQLQAGLARPDGAAARERNWIHGFERRLSRFLADSELAALNRDPKAEVPVSPLLGSAVKAAVRAAEMTGGLCDPTLVDEIESVGYRESRADAEPASLEEALLAAPARRLGRARPDRRWSALSYDETRSLVRRPPGLRFDTGGVGKGLAADLVASHLAGYERYVIDCGGDLRIGGPGGMVSPYEVQIAHPLSGEHFHSLRVAAGGVATSGLNRRVWSTPEGYAHHLIDPASGQPAWTGLISTTSLAPTAVEAEALATAALLAGPEDAPRILARYGGVLVRDSGSWDVVEAIASGEHPALHPTGNAEPRERSERSGTASGFQGVGR